EELAYARGVGALRFASEALGDRGRIECRSGKLESAQASFQESLAIARETADPTATIMALEHFAVLALARHAPGPAVTLAAAIARLRDEIAFHDIGIIPLAVARARLDDD